MRIRWSLTAVAVALALVGTTFASPAHAAPASVSDGTGPLDTAADLEAALALEERLLDHFHYDQPQSQRYRTPERITGDIALLVGQPDSGLYTGAYLAAQSYRYALARNELAKPGLSAEQIEFWTGQRDEAKDRVGRMVRKYHLLINIAKYWKTSFDLQIDQSKSPTDGGFIDFGGGLIPGEAGLLFRVCFPEDATGPFNLGDHMGPDITVTLPWEDGKVYDCVGSTSRDQYAGATHGLTTALNLVGPHDPELRHMAANDLMAMTDYAVKYLFFQPRPHGRVVLPIEDGGEELEGFISPLFVYTAVAQMNLIQVARNAANLAGTQAQRDKYEALWLVELATQLPQLLPGMIIDASNPHDAYYKFHLNHLTMDNVIRHEPNALFRDLMRLAFSAMDATTGDDGNALFEAIVYSHTGEPSRLASAVQHHREWLEYRAHGVAVGNIIDYSDECGTTYACVPTDHVDIVQPIGDTEIVIPQNGDHERPRSTTPVPVPLRRPADFLWQKDPTIIMGCGGGVLPDCTGADVWEGDGTDFLQTYWMIRYYTEVAKPAVAPLPTWNGPRFR